MMLLHIYQQIIVKNFCFVIIVIIYFRRILFQNTSSFHAVGTNTSQSLIPGGSFTLAVRNKIRCYFPRPSERKRIKRHGWWQRMSTVPGRRILMRRLLKGRYVLSH